MGIENVQVKTVMNEFKPELYNHECKLTCLWSFEGHIWCGTIYHYRNQWWSDVGMLDGDGEIRTLDYTDSVLSSLHLKNHFDFVKIIEQNIHSTCKEEMDRIIDGDMPF